MSVVDYLSDLFREQKYKRQFAEMVNTGSKTLIVDFEDLMREPQVAEELINNPASWLKDAAQVAKERLSVEDPEYAEKVERVNVRVRNLPEAVPLRKVGAKHINKFICVEGIVARASNPVPKVLKAAFACVKCETRVIKEQVGTSLEYPAECPNKTCRGKAFRLLPEETVYIDSQTLRIQERPEDLPPGRMPRPFDCKVVGEDLVDLARPGDHVRITGIVRAVPSSAPARRPSLAFEMYLEVNDIVVLNKETELTQLDEATIEKIKELAKDPWIYSKIINSIAPSIYGYEHIKEAIMYLLFGGVPKQHPDVKIRGEIHVLLVGDPGIAKSLLLQAAARLAPRGLYTSGRGTTAAGLCVSGDTLVVSTEGLLPIRDLVERNLSLGTVNLHDNVTAAACPAEIEVLSPSALSADMQLVPRRATQYYEIRTDKVVKVKTRLGRELVATPETPVLCSDGKRIFWKRMDEIRPGDRLVQVRRIDAFQNKVDETFCLQYIPDSNYVILKNGAFDRLMGGLRKRYGTLQSAAEALNVSASTLLYWKRAGARVNLGKLRKICAELNVPTEWLAQNVRCVVYRSWRKGGERTLIPLHPNETFMELLGDIYSNGCITKTRNRRPTVYYCSGSLENIERYRARVRELFGISAKAVKDRCENCYYVRFGNRAVVALLQSFGVPVGDKHRQDLRLPASIALAPKRLAAAFLRQVFTNDGCVVRGKCVSLSSADATFIRQIDLMLRRFGIVAGLRQKAPETVVVNGGLAHRGCLYELTIYDRESLELFKEHIGFGDEGKALQLEALLSQKKGNHNNFVKLNDRLILVRVREVTVEHRDKTYDLTVDSSHAFVANGFVVHNTAAVIKDKSGELNLEAGALVLADKGIACIDELDKMRPDDRSAMHEALEQQTVSLAKAGIVATLNARTAVLAAANPKFGRYDTSRKIGENVDLPVTLLSRFDLIFVMIDVPNRAQDIEMSRYILSSHGRIEPITPPVPTELLRQYIAYARQIRPVLTEEAMNVIQDYYLKLREVGADRKGPIAITPRQLEALIRIAEAHARIALRDKVTVEDAQAAVAIFDRSMREVCLDVATGKIDRDILETGIPMSSQDKIRTIYDVIQELTRETGIAEAEAVYQELEKRGVSRQEAEGWIKQLLREGKLYEPKLGYLGKT